MVSFGTVYTLMDAASAYRVSPGEAAELWKMSSETGSHTVWEVVSVQSFLVTRIS